jgi:hypothetical protein
MTSIGFATLEIIPSLKGVSEAIDKQLQGKVISVAVEPKVDTRAAQKAGKEAGEAVTKEVTTAVRKGNVGKTVGDEIASSAKKSSAGKEAAKVIVDGIADGVKREIPRTRVGEAIVDGIAEGVKQGIDGVGIGGQVVTTIGTGIKSGNLGGTIRDAVVPAVKGIGQEISAGAKEWAGNIGRELRSGDIQGATEDIGNTVRNTTDLIAEIGDTFGLQLGGVREFGDNAATTLSDVGTDIQNVITTATGINDTFNIAGDLLERVLPGKAGTGAGKIADALGKIAVPAWLTYLTADAGNKIANNIAGTDYSVLETLQQGATAPIRISGQLFGTPVPDWADPYVTNRRPDFIGGGGNFGVGGFTGSMPMDKIAGVVHGGEFVINADSTAGIQNAMPGLLDYLNNKGALPGFKTGGKVQLGNISGPGITTGEQQSMWDAVRSTFPEAILSSATRTVMTEGHPDFHNAGRAIDISGPGMGAIASWIASNYPDSLELIHSPFGHNIKNGKDVGDGTAFYGAGLMAAHRDHVHWALGKNARPASATGSQVMYTVGEQAAKAESAANANPTSTSDSTGSSGGGTSVVKLASSFSGLSASFGDTLSGINPTVSPDGKTESLDKVGSAVGQFAAGQVASTLGAFGIGDSPGWLKGIAQFANGIKIGGPVGAPAAAAGGGDGPAPMVPSIAPLASAATSTVGGFLGAPNAQPAQQVNYNIKTATVEDAFLQSQRLEKERAAANLARF